MAEKKTSFVLPTDLLSELEDFSDDEVGKFSEPSLIIQANPQSRASGTGQ